MSDEKQGGGLQSETPMMDTYKVGVEQDVYAGGVDEGANFPPTPQTVPLSATELPSGGDPNNLLQPPMTAKFDPRTPLKGEIKYRDKFPAHHKPPIHGGVQKSGHSPKILGASHGQDEKPPFNPQNPKMGQQVPRTCPPDEIPPGYWVGPGGYLVPKEDCPPDSDTEVLIVGGIAAGLRSLFGDLIEGSLPKIIRRPPWTPQEEQVWVNDGSGKIWRQGERWYGQTKVGHWDTLENALKNGHQLPRPFPGGYNIR